MDALVNAAALGSIVWASNLSEHFSQLDYSVNGIPRFLLEQTRGNRGSLRKAREAPRPEGFKWKALGTRLRARRREERERQLTTVRANQTTSLINGRATNWAPEVEFSPIRGLSSRQMTFQWHWSFMA